MSDRYDPLLDPDAAPCPHGCGELTNDPYGGPCSRCWRAVADPYDLDGDEEWITLPGVAS